MLSRTLRTSRAAPLRVLSRGGYGVTKRAVTTDAASAHADKDAVPEVCSFVCLLYSIGAIGLSQNLGMEWQGRKGDWDEGEEQG
jgi:hypothetical protein